MEYENKVIDEALQGTALDLPTQANSEAKKLYLESFEIIPVLDEIVATIQPLTDKNNNYFSFLFNFIDCKRRLFCQSCSSKF
jgi:hypothetical protein